MTEVLPRFLARQTAANKNYWCDVLWPRWPNICQTLFMIDNTLKWHWVGGELFLSASILSLEWYSHNQIWPAVAVYQNEHQQTMAAKPEWATKVYSPMTAVWDCVTPAKKLQTHSQLGCLCHFINILVSVPCSLSHRSIISLLFACSLCTTHLACAVLCAGCGCGCGCVGDGGWPLFSYEQILQSVNLINIASHHRRWNSE